MCGGHIGDEDADAVGKGGVDARAAGWLDNPSPMISPQRLADERRSDPPGRGSGARAVVHPNPWRACPSPCTELLSRMARCLNQACGLPRVEASPEARAGGV